MSSRKDRRLFVPLLVSVERQGSGSLGSGGLAGRLPYSLDSKASIIQGSALVDKLFLDFHQGESPGVRSTGPVREGSYRTRSHVARLFQSRLCGPESFRGLASHHRLVPFQQVCGENQVPDGDSPVSLGLYPEGRLDGVTGSEGRLPSGSGSSGESTLPSLRHRGGRLPVQGPMFRSQDLTTSFYEGHGSCFSNFAQSRYTDAPLSGRLVSSSNIFSGVSLGKGHGVKVMSGIRNYHKPREVAITSDSSDYLLRDVNRFNTFEGFADSQKMSESLGIDRRIFILRETARIIMEKATGPPFVSDSACSRGTTSNEVSSVDPETGMGFCGRGVSHYVDQSMQDGSPMVVRSREASGRLFSEGGSPRPHVLVRRLGRGLGGSSGGEGYFRPVVRSRKVSSHQFEGIEGSQVRPSIFSSRSPRSKGGCLFRQRDSHRLFKETRRHGLSCTQLGGPKNFKVGGGDEHLVGATVHSGASQRSGGFSFPSESSDSIRMDLVSGGCSQVVEEVAGEYRSFRYGLELSPTFVFFTCRGSSEFGDRLVPSFVGSSAGICVSPVRGDSSGAEQDQILQQPGSDVDSSVLAAKGVVPGPVRVSVGTSPFVTRAERSVEATSLPQVSSRSPVASSSCLETIQRFAKHEGFSARVARQVSFARRKSTNLVYQAKWDSYRKWCRKEGRSVSRPSLPKVADFLLYLHEVKHLSVSCIRGYRSMLSTVFRWKVPELATSQVIRDLLRSFSVQRPVVRVSPPGWDLDRVLKFLLGPPFEPLGRASFRDLTRKTLFLLASAKRVGELQALSARVAWLGDDLSVSYLPGFVAKTESETNPIPRYFVIKSLSQFVGNAELDRLLCPVRAIKFYLEATKSLVPRPANLFVSPRCRKRPLSKNAISFFLRDLIVDAGALGSDEGPVPRAHSIRGVSASLAFHKNWAVKEVLKAATWKSNSVFSSFYLKDVSFVWENCKSLGPFISAGQVINSSS